MVFCRLQLYVYSPSTVPLASKNPINGGNKEKEGITVREIIKRGG